MSGSKLKLRKFDIAQNNLNKALQLDSTLYAAHETLGDIAFEKKDVGIALERWQTIPVKIMRGELRKKIENAKKAIH